jgi:hypothetical protein
LLLAMGGKMHMGISRLGFERRSRANWDDLWVGEEKVGDSDFEVDMEDTVP